MSESMSETQTTLLNLTPLEDYGGLPVFRDLKHFVPPFTLSIQRGMFSFFTGRAVCYRHNNMLTCLQLAHHMPSEKAC